MMTMKSYRDKRTFAHQDKLVYNVITTGLSVGLSLNVFVSIRLLAKRAYMLKSFGEEG